MRALLQPVRDRVKRTKEVSVEDYLVEQVQARRGKALKLMRLRGWPDRLVLLPPGRVCFVECKRPKGGRYEPGQERVGAWLTRNGYNWCLLKTRDEVDQWLSGL